MGTKPRNDVLVWVDLETTGLDTERDVPLEMGLVLTDQWGLPQAKWSSLIIGMPDWRARLAANPFVWNMHIKSGLIADLDDGAPNLLDVQDEAISQLRNWGLVPGQLYMAGTTVHFDRAFLGEWMQDFAAFFHYRNFDVRSMLNAAEMLNPRVAEHAPKKRDLHRPIPDIEDSIATYKFLIDEFFLVD